MKLHLTRGEGQNLITGYTDDSIAINHRQYSSNLIVLPDTLITDWVSASKIALTIDNLTENDFEKIVFKKYPEIKKIKDKLYSLGAIYASMTGSGSAVFGLFNERIPIITENFDYFSWQGSL